MPENSVESLGLELLGRFCGSGMTIMADSHDHGDRIATKAPTVANWDIRIFLQLAIRFYDKFVKL